MASLRVNPIIIIPTPGRRMMIISNSTNKTHHHHHHHQINIKVGGGGAAATNYNNIKRPLLMSTPPALPLIHEEIVSPTSTVADEEAVTTILEQLERMFSRSSGAVRQENNNYYNIPLPPQLLGPYTPSHDSIGFSGGRPVRVAYQGVRGSYCQEAALKAFSSISNIESFAACNTMEDAFQALKDKSAQRAIVPLENSIDGTIDRNLDLLLRHDDVVIVGELIVPVNHCLLAVQGTSKTQLKRIVSHPQALSHCKSKLELLNLEVDEVQNSAEAARFLSENRIADTAVIGSRVAAKEFNLQIIEENLQDDSNGNFNRFLQLGLREGCSCSLHDQEEEEEMKRSRTIGGGGGGGGGGGRKKKKTTIAFSLEKGVTDLYKALGIFESENIRVTRVEQRPNRSNPVKMVVVDKENCRNHHHHQCRYYFDYVFILDLEMDIHEGGKKRYLPPPRSYKLKTALSQLEEISGFVRVLGSYTY